VGRGGGTDQKCWKEYPTGAVGWCWHEGSWSGNFISAGG